MLPLRRIWSLFEGGERPRALLLFLCIFLGAGLETAGIGLIMPFISMITDPSIVERYAALRALQELVGAPTHKRLLISCGAFLLLFYLFKNLYLACLYWAQNRFIYRKMYQLAERLFRTYLQAPYKLHLERNSAELQRNINIDVPSMFNWVVSQSFLLVGDVLVALVMTAMLIVINPLATLTALAVLLGVSLLFFRLVRRTTCQLGATEQRRFGQMIKWVNQGLSGIKEAKVLGIESFFVDAYSENNKGYTSARRTLLTVTEMPRLFFEAVAVGGLLIVVLVMLAQNRDLKSVLPTIAIFAAAAFRLMPAMTRIVKTTNMIKHFRPSFDVVFCDLRRFEGAATREDERGTPPPIPFHSAIELRGLGFRYSPESPPVLEDLDLCVEKNRTVAFVGPSGTGKTTLVDIILGLLPPSEGQVLVDGTDVQENMSAWQRTIGYIPQVIFLMDDTIRRNVAFGVPDDRIDDEDIWRALASAQLDEFARGLPEGLESMVGESGVRLSGGQRQRVGIARALYRDPDVLIFDEATSSLDQETELEINQTLSRLGGNKTILIIAHRLKTVESCDHIFFLKDGLLAASGTFGELLESSPEFRRMAGMDLQSAGAGS